MTDTTDDSASVEIARLRAEAAQAEAEAAEARAAAARAALEAALAGEAGGTPAGTTQGNATQDAVTEADAGPVATTQADTTPGNAPQADATQAAAAPADDTQADVTETAAPQAALSAHAAEIRDGYAAEGALLPVGVLLEDGAPVPDVRVGLPLATLNRHALVAGATGTGKTRTLQLMAEGLSAAGVPALVTDVKGDLTGLLQPGTGGEKLRERTDPLGQDWAGTGFPVELLRVGEGPGAVPVRTTVSDFGPLLLAKVLGLNDTQESALQLIVHWADTEGLALVDLGDLRSVVDHLTSDAGKEELRGIGGIATSTAGVILREVSALAAQGGEEFFGEPAFDTADLLRTAADGRGVLSVLRLPDLHQRPAMLSTFVMWLLADLFGSSPEVGDTDRPRLVFFFDEAHLLFADASKEFLSQVVRTVRLIRSKGIGIVFVTQSPTDVPEAVLAQLGGRVQHALRAHTPKDARALKEAVTTFPTSPYDLAEVLTSLGTGEAVVTVLAEDGAPTPVAVTRVLAPAAVMGPADDEAATAALAASPLAGRYAERVDPESATELLAARMEASARAAAAQAEAERLAEEQARIEAERQQADDERLEEMEKELEAARRREEREAERRARQRESVLTSMARTAGTSIIRSILGNRRR
ncbi:helicase HerA-like domain-containing protein [Georgenia sp. Z1491]|uniref:helicase HerA-like domain-containing protein n=1 Tax=Georgenia sp. Z1491 TaxID=3416707 RepID=UPI003CF06DC1